MTTVHDAVCRCRRNSLKVQICACHHSPMRRRFRDGSKIVLMRGHRVIVDNSVDAAVLARVLAVLEQP